MRKAPVRANRADPSEFFELILKLPRAGVLAAAGLIVAVAMLIGPATPARAADSTVGCGGDNERLCTTARATQGAKPRSNCPSGSFFDPRNGGECWSCPGGYKRTVLPPVTARNAHLMPTDRPTKRSWGFLPPWSATALAHEEQC